MIKKRLVGLLSHAKKYIIYNIFWQWISLLAQIGAVFAITAMLAQAAMFSGMDGGIHVGQTVLILVICVAVRFVCERMVARASYQASVGVKQILRKKIYEKMRRLGASYSEKVSTSEVMQVCTEGVEQLEIYFGKYLPQLFYSLLAPVILFLMLMRVSFRASILFPVVKNRE